MEVNFNFCVSVLFGLIQVIWFFLELVFLSLLWDVIFSFQEDLKKVYFFLCLGILVIERY